MRAGGLHRQQRTRHFVLALRTTLKALHVVFNAPLQWLVITAFEMQAIDPFQRSPIATVGDHFKLFLAASA